MARRMTAAYATDAFHALEPPLAHGAGGGRCSPRADAGRRASATVSRGSPSVGLVGLAGVAESDGGSSQVVCALGPGPIVDEMLSKEPATRALIDKPAIKERAMSRLRGGLYGLDEVQVARVRSAYGRFRTPLQSEVHKDDLPKVLTHLGYTVIDRDAIEEIGQEVSVFCAFDLIELCSFVERFAKFETSSMRGMFERFDLDSNGQICCDELRAFMRALGFTPLRSAVAEALAAVDEDHNGTLSFEEMVHLLEVYKATEGFTRPEVQAIYSAFAEEVQEYASGLAAAGDSRGATLPEANGLLPAQRLPHVLLRHFGPSSLEVATRLGKEVMGSSSSIYAEAGAASVGHSLGLGPCPPMSFQEVLLWARRFREITFQEWKTLFLKYDRDNSGSIGVPELQQLACDLGYTLHRDVIHEYLHAADEEWDGADKDGVLDYDELVNFMLILRSCEGFSESEQQELESVFRQFDSDGSGEIEVMELNGIFQYLGRMTRIEEVNRLLLKVDFNSSGSLDFREFLRLMRLYREEELQGLRRRFDSVARQPGVATISRQQASELLAALGYPSQLDEALAEDSLPPPGELRFDDVISMMDRRRAVKVEQKRRNAGFTEHEIKEFRELFASYDTDRSGVLSCKELAPLLEKLGLASVSKEDRDRVLEDMGRARELALAAGVTDVSVRGSGDMTFWELVQMLRLLYTYEDSRVLAREEAAVDETQFNRAEVDQFRECFDEWLQRTRQLEQEASPSRKQQNPRSPDGNVPQELTADAVRRLLGSVGVRLNYEHRQELDQRISAFQNAGRVSFPDFLRLMRWMLDTDFAGMLKVLKGP